MAGHGEAVEDLGESTQVAGQGERGRVHRAQRQDGEPDEDGARRPQSGLFDARGQERAAQFAHLGVELRDAYGDRDDGQQQMRRADQVPMGDREGEGDAQLPRDAASEALS